MKLCLFLLTINFFLCSLANAIGKEKLKDFFKEYDISDEKKNWYWDRLPYAIEKGYPDVAEFLILHGDPINNYTERVQSLKINDFRESLKNPNLMCFDYYKKHPLITAIRKNYANLVILLLQSIEDLTKAKEYKEIVANHTKYGPHILITDEKHALQIAIEESYTNHDIVLSLLLAGIDINMKYSYRVANLQNWPFKNFTPLQEAITLKKISIVQLLLDNNVDVECCYNVTPLYMAVEDNYIECVKLLLNYGADPLRNFPVGNFKNPLELAIQKEYWDIVDLFLEAAVNRVNSKKTP